MAKEKREFGPIKGQFPDPKKMRCRDCVNRDKTVLDIFDPPKPVGITKAFCDAYPAPPGSNGKPHDVLFLNADCQFYIKDPFMEE